MTSRKPGFAATERLAVGAAIALAFATGAWSRPDTARPIATAVTPDTQRVTIKVDGMFCESCEATVHAMLKRTRGVYSAKVDVKRGTATVLYDPTRTNPQALVDVIHRLGYKATLPPATKAKSGS